MGTSLFSPLPMAMSMAMATSKFGGKGRDVITMAIRSASNSSSSSQFPFIFPPNEPRLSLLLALSSQAASQAQRAVQSFVTEAVKYANPKRAEAQSLEEALMTVPDLETIPYRVLKKAADYEVREVESHVVAETVMPGNYGFDFFASSQAFNTLAEFLFGKNRKREAMEMTMPVVVSRIQRGEKMEMTTPVISQKGRNGQWQMAFLIPSKYGDDVPLPEDSAVKIRRIPARTIAVVAFSGYVTDDEIRQRERKLRNELEKDTKVQLKPSAQVEVYQYNPPFTPPFLRRNEIALEVEWLEDL